MRETATVKYALKSADEDFKVELVFNKKDFSLVNLKPSGKDWTRLAHHKCSHCPLNEAQSPFCPLASAIENIISPLQNFLSFDTILAQVEYNNRTVSSEVTVQKALSSLLGLIIPASRLSLYRLFPTHVQIPPALCRHRRNTLPGNLNVSPGAVFH